MGKNMLAVALWLILLINSGDSTPQRVETPSRPQEATYRRPVSYYSTAPPAQSPTCEFRSLVTSLNDRIDKLSGLDEDVRNRLHSIEHKLGQFEAANLANTETLDEKHVDLKHRLEHIEMLQENLQKNLPRESRQAVQRNSTYPEVNDSQKLNAIAELMVSSTVKIVNLKGELSANVSKLLDNTNTLLARLERLRHLYMKGSRVPSNYNRVSASLPEENSVTSCNQGAPTANGILKLELPHVAPFYVLCEEQFDHGGWTIIQNRHEGNINFQRDWQSYKTGFGNLAGDFFIGLEKLHALTSHAVHELAIILVDHDNEQYHARYNLFAIGNEHESYELKLLGAYSGNAGDAFTYHAGSKFSTFDNDNDGCVECNCASAHQGGWWYNWCDMSNLNGKYYSSNFSSSPTYQGMYWHHIHGPNYSLRSSRMMIRPLNVDDARH